MRSPGYIHAVGRTVPFTSAFVGVPWFTSRRFFQAPIHSPRVVEYRETDDNQSYTSDRLRPTNAAEAVYLELVQTLGRHP